MRAAILLLLFFCIQTFLFSQTADPWIRFTDWEKEKCGYKDLNGNIKIPAKFEALTQADTFYNIIAVNEEIEGNYISYYLLKSDRKVGKDSVYYFDFMPDCESEGKIIFRDKKSDRVGFFDSAGHVIIPAFYNYALPFHNGVAIARRNAVRKCWGREDSATCEHWGWDGGEMVLITEKNEVLIANWNVDYNTLNWYSMKVNVAVDSTIYTTVKGENGNTYSFIDYEKEFRVWFDKVFIPAANANDENEMRALSFSQLTYWSETLGEWKSESKDAFLQKYFKPLFGSRFQKVNTTAQNVSVGSETLNDFGVTNLLYNHFYNACGEHLKEVYPVFDVMLSYHDKNSLLPRQEHFEFIRTEAGYKLLNISVKDSKLF